MLFKKGRADPPPVRVDVTFGDAKAKRARLAARSNDGDTLHALIAATDDAHDREFLLHAALDGIARAPWIEVLPDRYPHSGAAWAIRGVHTMRWAWREHGGEAAGPPTDPSARAAWQDRMQQADDDLVQATRRGDDDPVPWSYLVATGAAVGLSFKEVCDRFDEADQRAPWLLLAHHHLVQATTPAWGGSDDTMFAVVADIAERAPDGCACHDAVVLAHLDTGRRQPDATDAPGLSTYLRSEAVATDLDIAARRSIESKAFEGRPEALTSRNLFAYAFLAAGEIDRAKAIFRGIADRPSEVPWAWDDPDAGLAFARARLRLGEPAAD